KAQLDQAEKAISDGQAQMESAEKKIADKQAELEAAPGKIEEAERSIAGIQVEIDENNVEKEALTQSNAQLETALDEINQQIEADPNNPILQAEKKELEKKYQDGLVEIEKVQNILDVKRAQFDQEKQGLVEKQKQYEQGLVALPLAKQELAKQKQRLATSK